MRSKQFSLNQIIFLAIIILGNLVFVPETSAFIYSNPSTTPIWTYSTEKKFISAVAISSDGKFISATSEDSVYKASQKANGTLYLFNDLKSTEKRPIWNFSIDNSFSSLSISKNGSFIVGGGGYDENRIYLLNNSSPIPQWTHYTSSWVYDVEISENGYLGVATGAKSYLFHIENASSPLADFIPTGRGLRVALSSNGSYMTISDNQGKIYLLKKPNLSTEWTYSISGYMSTTLSISADGDYIVSGGDKVYVFHKDTASPLWTYETNEDIESVKISKDGEYVVAGSSHRGNKLYFFSRSSSTPEWTFTARDSIISVAISKDGKYIAALSANYWVYLFNKSSSEPIWRYRLDGYPTAKYDYSLDMSSDGEHILAGGRHKIFLFDRDIVNPPKLVIPGYDVFFIVLIISLISIGFITSILWKNRYSKKKKRR